CRGDGLRRRIGPRGRIDEWQRGVVDVRTHSTAYLAYPCLLSRVATDQLEQRALLSRQLLPRLLPRHEKPRLAREDEPALPPLEVKHPRFERMGGDQHVLRMQRAALSVARVLHGDQKDGEAGADDKCEPDAREEHPLG